MEDKPLKIQIPPRRLLDEAKEVLEDLQDELKERISRNRRLSYVLQLIVDQKEWMQGLDNK
jgi:predicted metal-dependent hydrolase